MIEQLEQGILLPPQKAARFDDRRAVIRRAQILKQLRQRHLQMAALGEKLRNDPARQHCRRKQEQDQHDDHGHLERGRHRAQHVVDAECCLSRCGRHDRFSLNRYRNFL